MGIPLALVGASFPNFTETLERADLGTVFGGGFKSGLLGSGLLGFLALTLLVITSFYLFLMVGRRRRPSLIPPMVLTLGATSLGWISAVIGHSAASMTAGTAPIDEASINGVANQIAWVAYFPTFIAIPLLFVSVWSSLRTGPSEPEEY